MKMIMHFNLRKWKNEDVKSLMENDPIKLLYTCVYCHKLCLIVPQVKLVFVAALRYKFRSLEEQLSTIDYYTPLAFFSHPL